MLPDAGCGQDDPFGISFWPLTLGGATGNLIPQGALEYRRAQFVLAEEGKLAAVLEVEEIGQAVAADAFGASGAQQNTVDSVNRALSSRNMVPARMSHLPPCEREPSRLAILASTLEGGRENSLVRSSRTPRPGP